MKMLTTSSASSLSPYHKIFTHSISKTSNSYSLQTSFLPKFNPFCRSLRSYSTTRPSHHLSAASRPPSPPDSDPPGTGLVGKLSKFQDSVRIFVAVLFWMSLFFWYSAWDGRNSGKPPKKGSGFRR